jgi:adenylyltransferase/sulfurtransferase
MNAAGRYTRQTSLSSFGEDNQAKLSDNQVLIVGLGGLGLPVAQYLNAMGVGTLGLMDQDIVELHNLQRQVLYSEADIGKQKLDVTTKKLKEQNTTTIFKCFDFFLTINNALDIIKDFDVVVDATDNFATRYLINDACVMLNKPFVYGALHAFEGQVSVFNYKKGPTYRCLFPEIPKANEIANCDENGILGVLPGIIGTLQALEVVKLITGVGEVLSGKLLLFDGLTQTTQKIAFNSIASNHRITQLQKSYDFSSCEIGSSITAQDFIKLQEKNNMQLVDVRKPNEFDDSHLENAKNIPLSELKTSLGKIDFSIPIYLICQSGNRSATALAILESLESKAEIYNILGGMNEIETACL